ncbi:hypothetical protein GGTG_08655 [Gaeumannomyces tritici R3-111a-1]|uniref:Uncharacterized protein n=1 Tax=Gaeumannomyces tritici (strain R3-111a-1) TaxID=644352 RepID=J3P566_GAET3|nr:hypothetical protein GGTG_08655 [Gaeumannomyces tritici R3-111a-1]EJT74817.1 hypothetical protein GGTG_08655 [Gaeumannomyces tritici R3-111a-1]
MKFSIIALLPAVMAVAVPADLARRDSPETWCACVVPGTVDPHSFTATQCYHGSGIMGGSRGKELWCTRTYVPIRELFTDKECGSYYPGLLAVCKECSGSPDSSECPAK